MTKEEIIEARILAEYLFRSGGTVSNGVKYRRRKNVVLIRTREGGLMYNPYLQRENRKTDMYLSCLKLNEIYYEVLLRCDGYHNIADINGIAAKLFDMSLNEVQKEVQSIINEALKRNLIEEIPDVMAGRSTPITNEEVGAMAAASFVT
jgi:hypothetical protein